MTDLPPGVQRSSIPFLVKDLITVSDPTLIRKIAAHDHIARPGEVDVPLLFRIYFQATKFVYPPTGLYVLPLEGNQLNQCPARRAIIVDQLSKGFTKEQVTQLAALVKSKKDVAQVARECVKLIGHLILPLREGEDIPDDVADAAFGTLTVFSDVFNPFKYLSGRRSRKKVEDYCATLLPNEDHIGDYAHHLGAAAQGFAAALVSMRDMATDDVGHHFKNNPVTDAVLRMAKCNTTLDGIFPEDQPLLQNDTVIVLNISAGAKEAQDDLFLFGAGVDFRQCPFKSLFYSSTKDIHQCIRST